MRLDQFLKTSRFLKRRTTAKKLCDASAVWVNGRPAKASKEVAAGDEVMVHFANKKMKVLVVESGQGKKSPGKNRPLGYIITEEEKIEQTFF